MTCHIFTTAPLATIFRHPDESLQLPWQHSASPQQGSHGVDSMAALWKEVCSHPICLFPPLITSEQFYSFKLGTNTMSLETTIHLYFSIFCHQ
jgi:hypothetical protein